jgi:hypothetical protein
MNLSQPSAALHGVCFLRQADRRKMLMWCDSSTFTHLCAGLLLFGLPAGPVLGKLWAVPDSSSREALSAQPQQLH